MTDKPDPQELAKQLMQLWQQQLSATAQDPKVAEGFARNLAMWNMGALTFAPMMKALQEGKPYDFGFSGTKPSAGAQAASPSPDDSYKRWDELTARLDALERQLRDLERTVKRNGKRPDKKG